MHSLSLFSRKKVFIMQKWLLVDGFNLAFRSHYGMPELARSDGLVTGAIHGWLRTLWYLEDNYQPFRMLVFFDLGHSGREKQLISYKANRKETPEALVLQMPWIKKLTLELGHSVIEKEDMEADDLIASIAKKVQENPHAQLLIVSADKDLAQILAPNVFQLIPPPTQNPKLGWRILKAEDLKNKFGVDAHQIVDYLALIGDTSDNIPGLPGVGPKTAAKWIQQFGSLQNILQNSESIQPARFQEVIKSHAQKLLTYVQLITLRSNLNLPIPAHTSLNTKSLLETLNALEMKTSIQKALKRYQAQTEIIL